MADDFPCCATGEHNPTPATPNDARAEAEREKIAVAIRVAWDDWNTKKLYRGGGPESTWHHAADAVLAVLAQWESERTAAREPDTDERETLAETIENEAGHDQFPWWRWAYSEHFADAILESDWLAARERAAERRGAERGWERGFSFSYHSDRGDHGRDSTPPHLTEDLREWNPYRAEQYREQE